MQLRLPAATANPGVECDFGRMDDPAHSLTSYIDCKDYAAPPSDETCDGRMPRPSQSWADVGETPECDNRGSGLSFFGGESASSLKIEGDDIPTSPHCQSNGGGYACTAHAWVAFSNHGGDNYRFRAVCECERGGPSDTMRTGWSPALTVWRKLDVQWDDHSIANLPSDYGEYTPDLIPPTARDAFVEVTILSTGETTVQSPMWLPIGWGPNEEADACEDTTYQALISPVKYFHDEWNVVGVTGHSGPWIPAHWLQGMDGFDGWYSAAVGRACYDVNLHYFMSKEAAGSNGELNRDDTPPHEFGHFLLNLGSHGSSYPCGSIWQTVLETGHYNCTKTYFSAGQVNEIRQGGWAHE